MKPKVICHMMSSVDGRLVADRWTPPFDGTEQDKMYDPYYEAEEELGAYVWMIGNNTIQIDNQVEIFDYKKYAPAKVFNTYIGKRETKKTCIIFDASYQDESEGLPHYLDDPFNRVEDIRCAIDYLVTLPYIDENRIGAMGICAGAGYAINATQTEYRIQAVAGVSTWDVGDSHRNGFARKWTDEQKKQLLLDIAAFHAFDLIETISPRPILLIIGSRADTKYFTDSAYENAKEPKEIYTIQGASHIDLYDKSPYVEQVTEKLTDFFRTTLKQ